MDSRCLAVVAGAHTGTESRTGRRDLHRVVGEDRVAVELPDGRAGVDKGPGDTGRAGVGRSKGLKIRI